MFKKLLFIAVCMTFPALCYGQTKRFDPARSYEDISSSAGVYLNAKGDLLKEGTIYTVDAGHFSYHGIGIRAGVNYINALDDKINVVSVPVSFAWRSPFVSAADRVGSTLDSYARDPDQNFGAALFMMTVFRLELNAGLTPGFITGKGYSHQGWSSSWGNYTDGVSVRSRFMLSADAGMRISWRIWRFNLIVSPQYHYWLTNNFDRRSTIESLNNKKLSRSYVSVNFGLAFMF